MRDFTDELREQRRRLGEASSYLNIDEGRNRIVELEAEMQRPDLWDDTDAARKINAEYAAVKDDLDVFDGLAEQLDDADVLHELAREEDDESQEGDIEEQIASIAAALDRLELRSLFTGEHDDSPCIVQINAKDGGVDAQDFAEMLLRMYARWAERRGFDITLNYASEGVEAGINSAEFTLAGRYAYGLMTGSAARTAWCGSAPSTIRGAVRPVSPRCRCGPNSTRPTSRSTRPTSAWRSSGRRAPVVSTSTRPRRRFV